MIFSSPEYFLFCGLMLLLNWSVRPFGARKLVLLAGSLFFYSKDRPALGLLMVGLAGLDAVVACAIVRISRPGRRRLVVVLTIVANVAVLAVFKYWNFLADVLGDLAALAGAPPPLRAADIVLPVGISFYIFQSLSYVVDVHHGIVRPARIIDALLFVVFFPQLIAGPIVRAGELLPQFVTAPRFDRGLFMAGLDRFVWGLVKKALVADQLALLVDDAWARMPLYSPAELAVVALAFVVHVYADFSGYSDIAIGTARMLGFRLPENFACPYLATSVSDLWRRWHMTLGRWLRDYVYIPIGGSRGGLLRTGFNLVAAFGLCGLWHGAAWKYVVFGVLQGLFCFLERVVARLTGWEDAGDRRRRWARPFQTLYVLVFWTFCMVLFRAPDIPSAMRFIGTALPLTGSVDGTLLLPFLYATALLSVGGIVNVSGFLRAGAPSLSVLRGACYAAAAVLLFLYLLTDARPFVYFEF